MIDPGRIRGQTLSYPRPTFLAAKRRKPGTDTKFPVQFAGNWLSVPGFAPRATIPVRRVPKRLSTPTRRSAYPNAVWYEDRSMRSALAFIHPRDEILQAIQRIYRYRMTTTSGGNLSIREDTGDIWITPARLDKGSLRREDIVCVRADGTVLGPHVPSSELPFHQEVYRERHDIHGIVHAHPVALVAFSLVHRIPDTHLFHQTRLVCGEAGFAT